MWLFAGAFVQPITCLWLFLPIPPPFPCPRSNHYTHIGPHDWICLDSYPEAILTSSGGDENGALIYPTETESPPTIGPGSAYLHNREVTCAVCTMQGSSSTTYVQYGRRLCTTGTTVYTGYLAGAYFNHEGSGPDYLCMTASPDFMYGISDGNQVCADGKGV